MTATMTATRKHDRRASDRFPIEQEVRFKLVEVNNAAQTGVGRTLDMSSGGILFTTDQPLAVGKRLELSVNWPAQLNNTCALKLVALGRLIWADQFRAAVAIERYEFRTRGSKTF